MLNLLLSALRRGRETPEIRAAFEEFLQRLGAGQVAANALKPGDPIRISSCPTATGGWSALTNC